MTSTDIQYREISSSSLSFGSTFSEADLLFYSDGSSSLNFPFGKLDTDFVKFSVFNTDFTPVTSSNIIVGGEYTPHSQSYYDPSNNFLSYSYTSFKSNWVIVGSATQSLFLDIASEMNSLGLGDGNYVIVSEMLRNVVGDNQNTLIINNVSSTRDEISLIPKTLAGSGNRLVDDISIFANGQIRIKEVAQDYLTAMASPQMYSAYYAAAVANPSGSLSLKYNYGFSSHAPATGSSSKNTRSGDIDIISFITDIYYGVKKGNLRANGQYANNDIIGIYDQFNNWLLSNYESGASFDDIKNYYYSLFRFAIDLELNHITNHKPADYDIIVAFLQSIFYDQIFYPVATSIESAYNVNLGGYFKNYINFPDGTTIAILNKKLGVSTDPKFNNTLILKLSSPLPLTIDLNAEAWITNNFGSLPLVQNLYFFTAPVFNTIKLRGPNFLVKVENEGNSTEELSMEELVEETGSLYNELISKIETRASGTIDTTDYRYFSNFVNFSSAVMRMDAYDWKKSQIDSAQANVVDLTGKLALNPNDVFYASELSDANSAIDSVEASMDGYEKFLYTNNQWYAEHSASASIYDDGNNGSLINSLPEFIVDNAADNADYITFVGMIGHFFDNLSLSMKQITEKNNYAAAPNYGISLDVVGDMLHSLGWDAEISKDNLPLILASFSKQDFDVGSELYNAAQTFSEEERNQVIWKRILNSLPLLYKTKGTQAGLDALISCFGIPKNIIKIKEYGGIYKVANLEDTTTYVLDEVKYEPYFSGSGEYFSVNWTGSAQTVEFNFAFDSSKISSTGEIFRLVNCSGSWAMGAYRENGLDWGRMFFTLSDGSGGEFTVMTSRAPIFDGTTYHTMLRRRDPDPSFGLSSASNAAIDVYPITYDLVVQRASDTRITYAASASYNFSGSYNTTFRQGSYLYIGNYEQSTASLSIDPEAFFGNIDEIKVWESAMSDERFANHTLHQNAYDLDSPQQMVSENLVRISFERPVDLYDASTSSSLNNLAFRSDFPTFLAMNFPAEFGPIPALTMCDPGSGSAFPYQFTRKDSIQTVKLPTYGASKFRSNKINYVQQQLISNLSPTQRASVQTSKLMTVDSNRLGVFFSPTEIQNTEIIKFFGDYPLMDLIGDPSSIYDSSYRRFEVFKKIFYDQGFGAVDYQFFMNIVRFYFDKAMLKYIKSMIPARAKLVDGILIEPSILERPKIELKPIVQETIAQQIAEVNATQSLSAAQIQQLSTELTTRHSGVAILNDINRTFYPIDDDKYGFVIFADSKGLTYYNGHYYRVDVANKSKKYQVWNTFNLPSASLNDYENNVNLHGTVQTITKNYKTIEIARLPIVTEYPMTMSFTSTTSSFYFSGSVSFTPAFQGYGLVYQLLGAHSILGKITGSIVGHDPRVSNGIAPGTVLPSGLYVSASADISPTGSILYTGNFSLNGALQMFEGSVSFVQVISGPITVYDNAKYNTVFYSPDHTSSIFAEFTNNTQIGGTLFLGTSAGLDYRKEVSMRNYPTTCTLLNGYGERHYKYGKKLFSQKIVNSYDQNGLSVKWKRNSQNKKTTVNATSGLLDNSSPVETKTA